MAEKYTHKLTKKNKYSYFVVLPKEIIDEFGWRDGQKLDITAYGKEKIMIKDWKKKK